MTVTLHRDPTTIHTTTFRVLLGVLHIRQFLKPRAIWPFWVATCHFGGHLPTCPLETPRCAPTHWQPSWGNTK